MKYRRGYRSKDTEYRGSSRGKVAAGGVGGLGIIGVLLALLFGSGGGEGGFGVDLGELTRSSQVDANAPAEAELPPRNSFLEFVFDDVQNMWTEIFADSGEQYPRARFVIFDEATETGGCGVGTAEVGPFYCPADQQVYLDQTFFDELARRFGAPGDFAQAYVVAHEVGHHIQTVTGISNQVRRLQSEQPDQRNELSVRQELMADCLAGIWASSAADRGLLEPGDIDEGLGAAAAVGDDRIQKAATGQVDPHTWTHGSSSSRQKWFTIGFDEATFSACDTFSGDI